MLCSTLYFFKYKIKNITKLHWKFMFYTLILWHHTHVISTLKQIKTYREIFPPFKVCVLKIHEIPHGMKLQQKPCLLISGSFQCLNNP